MHVRFIDMLLNVSQKKFLWGIIGEGPVQLFWHFFQEKHFWSIKGVYFFQNSNKDLHLVVEKVLYAAGGGQLVGNIQLSRHCGS